ncbi:hypothetical protein Ancab_034967 [Ancistrocladus abbreviatus]
MNLHILLFRIVLAAAGQLARLDKVVEVSKRYLTNSLHTYVARTCSKLTHVSEAHMLVCLMWAFHDNGDRHACVSMLESLCGAGKVPKALDLVDKIHEKGSTADAMMHNLVLDLPLCC